jgi:hypothetical protein
VFATCSSSSAAILVKILSWFCRNVGGELTVQPGSVEPKVSIGDAGKEETAQKNRWRLNPLVIIRGDVDMGNRVAVDRWVADRGAANWIGMAHEGVLAMA